MTDLATQIEQAGPEQQREMLLRAWEHIYGFPSSRVDRGLVYHRLLSIGTDEAFTGAALMLVPDGLEWELLAYDAKRDPRFGRFQARIMLLRYEDDPEELGPQSIYNAATPALAIAAACVRVHDKENGV